jgi:DNA-binding MarR family transcriptional regulator
MESQKMTTPYIHFVNLRDQFVVPFDLTAGQILDLIGACADQEPLTVTGCMASGIASPATTHRKINDLICFGYVQQEFKGGNKRTKYLVPTDKAKKYFEQLSAAIKVAAMGAK